MPVSHPSVAPSNDGYRTLYKLKRRSSFYCKGTVAEGVKIQFNRGGSSFTAADWKALIQHFASRPSVVAGTSRDNPPSGSLGAYLVEKKGVNLASFLLPIMLEEGLVNVMSVGRSLKVGFEPEMQAAEERLP